MNETERIEALEKLPGHVSSLSLIKTLNKTRNFLFPREGPDDIVVPQSGQFVQRTPDVGQSQGDGLHARSSHKSPDIFRRRPRPDPGHQALGPA